MKVGILAFNNIRYCPYISPYANIFGDNGIEYEIIYFDRNDENTLKDNVVPVKWHNNKSKIVNFISYSKQVKRILRQNKYDLIVALATTPGILLTNYLCRKYKNNYIVDIRDYTFENNSLFRILERQLINNSAMNVISAPGFVNFLPQNKYYICHNTTYDFSNNDFPLIKKNPNIVIGYVGSLAYANQCKMLIELVKRDERFSFFFYGNESVGTTIQDFIKAADCDRIQYFGKYEPSEKERIIKSVDILFNAYGNDSKKLIYAISNKFYDSLYYGKPVITSPNTDMSAFLEDLSFDIDDKTVNLNELYNWYQSIDQDRVNDVTKRLSKTISKDQDAFEHAVKHIFLHIT